MKKQGSELYKNALVVLLVIASFAIIYFAYVATYLGLINRVLLPIAFLIFAGAVISRLKHYKSLFIVYMVGGSVGIGIIEALSKHGKRAWYALCEWGLCLGFGLLTYKIMRGKVDKRILAVAIVSLFLIIAFLIPLMQNALLFINIPQIQNNISFMPGLPYNNALHYIEAAVGAYSPLIGVVTLVTLLTGFTGFIFFLLAVSAFEILAGTYAYILTAISGHAQVAILTSQIPGAAPIIPGIFIPLIPGIIALALMLIIHEFSHGVLSRLAKVKVLSTGILVFGVIPIGGFVEPDEKQIKRLPNATQTSIMSAGISSNFLAALLFALPMLLILVSVPHLYVQQFVITATTKGYPAYGVIAPGSVVSSWNGQKITNASTLAAATAQDKPGALVSIGTTSGTYTFAAVASPTNASRGLVGVELGSHYAPGITQTLGGKVLFFLYTLFSLLVMLNFFVAVFNILPLPGLDGWRIYEINIKNKKLIKALVILIAVLIVINILPLFYALA